MALGEGRASVRELAARLGRTRSSLHYHAGVLERAGMIKSVEVRGTGRERETVYAAGDALAVNARNKPAELDVARRAGQALLRLTGREMARALEDTPRTGGAVPRALFAARGKARLTRTQLARVNALIEELLGLFAEAPAEPGQASELHALTVVLTPSRDANAQTRRRRGRVR